MIKYADIYNQMYQSGSYSSTSTKTLFDWCEPLLNRGDIIDLGCGHAIFSKYAKDHTYVGVDVSDVVIAKNKSVSPDTEFRVFDLTSDYPVNCGTFQNVVVCDVLELFEEFELVNVIDNIRSCCAINTRIFISIIKPCSFKINYNSTEIEIRTSTWDPAKWINFLQINDLHVKSYRVSNSGIQLACICKRLVSKLGGK